MIKALAITGPTASGKTALSLDLAMSLGCEIISLDSMQIYKGMDIGTAKATEAERACVAHHMIDLLDPSESYSAQHYREDALACAEDIASRGKIPMLVGGTGLYMDTLLRGSMISVPESSPEYRESLMALGATSEGLSELHRRLCEVDPESAEAIHKNNLKRVVRALEIYETTGKPKSYFDRLSKEVAPDISVGMITLDFHDRENLYKRIDDRVDKMLKEGLVDEARRLLDLGFDKTATASSAIGYKELFGYIRGDESLQLAAERIRLASRRYAKRQLTWFRHNSDAYRLYLDNEDSTVRTYADVLSEARGVLLEFCNKMEINIYK